MKKFQKLLSNNKKIIISIFIMIIYLIIFYIWLISYSLIQPISSYIENWTLIEIHTKSYYFIRNLYLFLLFIITLINFIVLCTMKKIDTFINIWLILLAIVSTILLIVFV